ncbi:unnamed protein product [Camellia sinensis]
MVDQIEFSRTSLLIPYQLQAKRKGSGVRTWFVVSKLGNSQIEELGKQEIMRRSGVQAQDLRVVEPELSNPSAILRRERAIVVNLEHIKAIITANEVLVPNPKDPFMVSFVRDLEFKLSDFGATMGSDKAMKQSPSNTPPEASDSSPKSPDEGSNRGNSKPLPFEFRAFEICLESVCRSLESEATGGISALKVFLRSERSNLEIGVIFKDSKECKQRRLEARRWISGRMQLSMHISIAREAIYCFC